MFRDATFQDYWSISHLRAIAIEMKMRIGWFCISNTDKTLEPSDYCGKRVWYHWLEGWWDHSPDSPLPDWGSLSEILASNSWTLRILQNCLFCMVEAQLLVPNRTHLWQPSCPRRCFLPQSREASRGHTILFECWAQSEKYSYQTLFQQCHPEPRLSQFLRKLTTPLGSWCVDELRFSYFICLCTSQMM